MIDRTGKLFGNYRLVRLIGRGGFAEVYLGEHIDLGTEAAIKVLHTKLDPTDIDAFRREARTIAHLRHPHIIRVLDFNATGSTPFLVMDYAVGGTMRQRYPKGSIVPLATIVSSVQQVADALQYAHDQKLIHRDIKPENILLDQRDNVLLSDFGIALVAQSSRSQSTQDVIGTASYMAPEQIQGKPRAASDQYSLAIVVYEWLSGSLPFEGSLTELWSQHMFAPPPLLRERVREIPKEVEHVIMTALSKDPKQRFGSVQAFANAFQQAIQPRERAFSSVLRGLSDDVGPSSIPPTIPAPISPGVAASSTPLPVKDTLLAVSAESKTQVEGEPVLPPTLASPTLPKPGAQSGPRSHAKIFIILGVLILLILAGIITGGAIQNQMSATQMRADAQATAQVLANNPYPSYLLGSGTLAFVDPLSQANGSQWSSSTNGSGGACRFTGGAYHVSQQTHLSFNYCPATRIYSNFTFEVQMTITQGDCGGMIFREGSNGQQFYFFRICQDGNYGVARYSGSDNTDLRFGKSLAVQVGLGQGNKIAVVANGRTITFYVNEQQIDQIQDNSYTSGSIGLIAAPYYQTGSATDVAYSNARLWTL